MHARRKRMGGVGTVGRRQGRIAGEELSLGGDRRAVSHMAMFQISGAVPKRALTAGTCRSTVNPALALQTFGCLGRSRRPCEKHLCSYALRGTGQTWLEVRP